MPPNALSRGYPKLEITSSITSKCISQIRLNMFLQIYLFLFCVLFVFVVVVLMLFFGVCTHIYQLLKFPTLA